MPSISNKNVERYPHSGLGFSVVIFSSSIIDEVKFFPFTFFFFFGVCICIFIDILVGSGKGHIQFCCLDII